MILATSFILSLLILQSEANELLQPVTTETSICDDPNAIYTACGSACPPSCDNQNSICLAVCTPGCQCQTRFVLGPNGNCIDPDECTQATTTEEPDTPCTFGSPLTDADGLELYCGRGGQTCPDGSYCEIAPTDIYAVCCESTTTETPGDECDTCSKLGLMTGICPDGTCYSNCGCIIDADGECVNNIVNKDDVCPDTTATPLTTEPSCDDPNAAYNECGSACPLSCDNQNRDCIAVCVSECQCQTGFVVGPNGICIEADECPQETTTEDPDTEATETGTETTETGRETTDVETSTDNYCDADDLLIVNVATSCRWDNSLSVVGKYDLCELCLCEEEQSPRICQAIADVENWPDQFETIFGYQFNRICSADVYTDLQDEDGNQCALINVRPKSTNEITECNCDALYCCEGDECDAYRSSDANTFGIFGIIGFIMIILSWM